MPGKLVKRRICTFAGTNYLPTPKGWIAWLARAHVYVYNLLRVMIRSNSKARTEI